jgi:hypothetical protein
VNLESIEVALLAGLIAAISLIPIEFAATNPVIVTNDDR